MFKLWFFPDTIAHFGHEALFRCNNKPKTVQHSGTEHSNVM